MAILETTLLLHKRQTYTGISQGSLLDKYLLTYALTWRVKFKVNLAAHTKGAPASN